MYIDKLVYSNSKNNRNCSTQLDALSKIFWYICALFKHSSLCFPLLTLKVDKLMNYIWITVFGKSRKYTEKLSRILGHIDASFTFTHLHAITQFHNTVTCRDCQIFQELENSAETKVQPCCSGVVCQSIEVYYLSYTSWAPCCW